MTRISQRGLAFYLALLTIPASGCGGEDSAERVEGRRVLDVLHTVRRASRRSEAYRDAVGRLAEVAVTDARVGRVRDTCVSGHEAVLRAEAEALRARQLYERFGPSAEETQAAIDRGNQMATEAERQISRCGAQSMSLGMRIDYQAPAER